MCRLNSDKLQKLNSTLIPYDLSKTLYLFFIEVVYIASQLFKTPSKFQLVFNPIIQSSIQTLKQIITCIEQN